MDDRKLLKRAREDYVLGSDYTIRDLFDRFEQMLDEKEPKPKSIVWEPEVGEEYFYIDERGIVFTDTWVGIEHDLELLKNHNVYKTRELAKKAVPYLSRYNMVAQAVMHLEPDQVVDWSDVSQLKYTVYFDHRRGIWCSDSSWRIAQGYPPLTDEKNIQPLLDDLNAKEK